MHFIYFITHYFCRFDRNMSNLISPSGLVTFLWLPWGHGHKAQSTASLQSSIFVGCFVVFSSWQNYYFVFFLAKHHQSILIVRWTLYGTVPYHTLPDSGDIGITVIAKDTVLVRTRCAHQDLLCCSFVFTLCSEFQETMVCGNKWQRVTCSGPVILDGIAVAITVCATKVSTTWHIKWISRWSFRVQFVSNQKDWVNLH